MILRTLVVFVVAGLSIAAAKSYQVIFNEPVKAGTMQLKPGTYDVAVEGSKVRFRDSSGKTTEATATIVNSDKKFHETAVNTSKVNGESTISEIDLGGTTTKVQFDKGSGGTAAQ